MLMNKLGSLFVPQHLVEDQTPPEDFVRKLQATFGRDMHVEWNSKKQRWVIEVCHAHHQTRPDSNGITYHSHLCGRYYAWMVRDEETDEFMPLCDRVIEKLHEKETYRKYGVGDAALARFRQESKDFDDEQKQKQQAMIRENIRHARRDNRTTWNKFMTLFQRHDMRPN